MSMIAREINKNNNINFENIVFTN